VWLFWPARRPTPAKSGETLRQQAEQSVVRDPAPDPAPTAPALPAAAPSKPAEYALQVYSFRTSNKAEESAKYLRGLNFPSFVSRQEGEDDGWYVVYVGPFGDPEAARKTGSELRAATGSMAVLRERPR
jgi:cell division septation protein DedD